MFLVLSLTTTLLSGQVNYNEFIQTDSPEGVVVYNQIDTTAIIFQFLYDDGGMTAYERDRWIDMMFADGYMTSWERKRVVDYMLYYGRKYERNYPVGYYEVVTSAIQNGVD